MVEILALEVDPRSPALSGETPRRRERVGSAGVGALQFRELLAECGVSEGVGESGVQLVQCSGEGLGDETTAIGAEVSGGKVQCSHQRAPTTCRAEGLDVRPQ